MSKARLTVTIDPHLVRAGNDEVAAGRVDSLSAWVNLALIDRAAKDRRLRVMKAAIEAYEQTFGEITEDEMVAQARADRAEARVVRGRARRSRARARKGAA
jgi:hypothetical protein